MDYTKWYFIKLLSSYVNDTPISNDDKVDWNEVLYLAKIHNVQVIVYIILKRNSIKPPIWDELEKQFFASVNISTQQEIYTEELLKVLADARIDCTLFKGYVLRAYYPDKEARTMGDVDILIDEKNRDKSHEVIQKAGFKYDADGSMKDVWSYNKGALHTEIHTHIIYGKLFSDFDYISYFDEKSKNKRQISEHRFELKPEDHFVYALSHLAKHFYGTGAGIRMLMDFVFFKKTNPNLDFDYIATETENIGMYKFSQTIFAIANTLFDCDFRTDVKTTDEALIAYIVNHGVFGFDEKNVYDVKFNRDGKSKLVVLFERIFLPYDKMVENFIWFRNGKKYQMPYAWVRRWAGHITQKKRREELKDKFNVIFYPNEDGKRHSEMLKLVGLKK